MPIPNPEHLLDQAERLAATGTGAPRQTNLRRAISAAYYAVFHRTLVDAFARRIEAAREVDDRAEFQRSQVFRLGGKLQVDCLQFGCCAQPVFLSYLSLASR